MVFNYRRLCSELWFIIEFKFNIAAKVTSCPLSPAQLQHIIFDIYNTSEIFFPVLDSVPNDKLTLQYYECVCMFVCGVLIEKWSNHQFLGWFIVEN